MRAVFAILLLTGCGAAQRAPTDEERRALEAWGRGALACDGPLRFTADPESMLVEACADEGPAPDATDVISALAACRRTERVEVPIEGPGAWRVDGCGRSVVVSCGPLCDGRFGCIEWELVGRIDCATYRRG